MSPARSGRASIRDRACWCASPAVLACRDEPSMCCQTQTGTRSPRPPVADRGAPRAEQSSIVAEVLQHAVLGSARAPRPSTLVRPLIAGGGLGGSRVLADRLGAAGLGVHRLSCDDSRWNCSICVRGLAINWVEDVAEFQHDNPALAIFGALVQAQLRKIQGLAPSNVTPFRRMHAVLSESPMSTAARDTAGQPMAPLNPLR